MSDTKEEPETVDFAYAIDCTGSMSSYIKQTQTDIQRIVDEMKRQFPAFKLRLACVAYRDWCDSNRLESQNFTENVDSFKQYVGKLVANGGGDTAEDVLGGLNCAAGLSWNSKLRVLFHICDAPPHHKMYHDVSSDDYPSGHPSDPSNYHEVVLDKFKARNIHLCIGKLNSSVSKMISVFKDYAKRIELTIEERSVSDASQLLGAVQQTLTILTKMRKDIKETKKEMDQISDNLSSLRYDSKVFVIESMNKMDAMNNDIVAVNGKMEEIDTSIVDAKRDYDELKSKHSVLIAYARSASSADDIEKAENDVMDLNVSLSKVNETYSEAQDKLNDALRELTEKQKDLHTTDAKVTAKTKEKAEMKNKISALSGKLDGMDSLENRETLRKEIKQKLKDVRKLFNDDIKVKNKIMTIRRAILTAFTEANKKKKHVNDCKRDIEAKLNELDSVLDDLDDRAE